MISKLPFLRLEFSSMYFVASLSSLNYFVFLIQVSRVHSPSQVPRARPSMLLVITLPLPPRQAIVMPRSNIHPISSILNAFLTLLNLIFIQLHSPLASIHPMSGSLTSPRAILHSHSLPTDFQEIYLGSECIESLLLLAKQSYPQKRLKIN